MTLLGAEFGFLEVEPHAPEDRRPDRDVILLLHGTGGNKFEWSFPAWRGWNYDHENDPENRHSDNHVSPPWNLLPRFSLSDKRDIRCWRTVLLALGHTIIYYSQDGEDDAIEVARDQFEDLIVPFIRDNVLTGALAGKKVVVIGHSRGGILTRLYLARHAEEASDWVQRVITLNSPHHGTDAPNATRRLRDEIQVLALLLGLSLGAPFSVNLLLGLIIRFGFDVDPTDAQAQLVPGDALFAQLSLPADTPDIAFHTFGGSSVTVTRVYAWYFTPGSFVPRWTFPNPVPHWDWTLFPVEIAPISPMLDAIPDAAVFAEQRQGEGDVAVTIASAQLPGVPHRTLPIHHGEAFWDEPLFAEVADILGTPLGNTVADECQMGFVGNRRTLELHDLSRERRNCQIAEILAPWPFERPQDAFDEGYDGCAYCMPEEHHSELP
jgi:pimeloyl-ACP methyl ester carboxylesterase